MRFRFQLAAVIGCAGLLALSLPAFGSPSVRVDGDAPNAPPIVHVLPKSRPRDARQSAPRRWLQADSPSRLVRQMPD